MIPEKPARALKGVDARLRGLWAGVDAGFRNRIMRHVTHDKPGGSR
jgi:hypothetical protein